MSVRYQAFCDRNIVVLTATRAASLTRAVNYTTSPTNHIGLVSQTSRTTTSPTRAAYFTATRAGFTIAGSTNLSRAASRTRVACDTTARAFSRAGIPTTAISPATVRAEMV